MKHSSFFMTCIIDHFNTFDFQFWLKIVVEESKEQRIQVNECGKHFELSEFSNFRNL